jgi:ribosomal-protein-alanine N-acetyltransferase
MEIIIRPFQPGDLETLQRLTIESFEGLSLDQNVERAFGVLHGHDWRWRKVRSIEDDVRSNVAGVFVAEAEGRILGYITTQLDRTAGKARMPNLAVDAAARGQGLGRRLIQHALDYLRDEGIAYAMIETMAGNEIGEHLYPACGFTEVGRLIHFGIKL